MRGSSCPGGQFTTSHMERNLEWMNSANRKKRHEWRKLKQKTLLVFQAQGEQSSTYPLSHRNIHIHIYTHAHIHMHTYTGKGYMHLCKKKAQTTEHTHSILATCPELDGTGLECLSYAMLHFNSRRTGQSVFMIRRRSLAEEKQVCIWNSLLVPKHCIVCLFWREPLLWPSGFILIFLLLGP